MSRADAERSVVAGIEIVNELLAEGPVDMLGTGDMGIGNTTPSSAVIAAFSGIAVEKLTGRGTGIDDAALANKIRVIENALALHRPDPRPAGCAGQGGRLRDRRAGRTGDRGRGGRHPVVCDGLIATAGALIACELAPAARAYLFASHRSVEVGHRFMHERLGVEPRCWTFNSVG
jgi:nicotinate-nucleotide--dimethylbenzimidazole phosphoribosyltransferase